MEKLIRVESSTKPDSITITPTIVDVISNLELVEKTDPMDSSRISTSYIYDVDRYSIVEWGNLLSTQKSNKIALSKSILQKYLADHPLEYKGKYYTVTQDKQNQLIGTLNMYKETEALNAKRIANGLEAISFELTWNATNEPCTTWTYDELSTLMMNIYAYVKILVTEQQYIEVAIEACNNKQELESIVIDYDTCPYTPGH